MSHTYSERDLYGHALCSRADTDKEKEDAKAELPADRKTFEVTLPNSIVVHLWELKFYRKCRNLVVLRDPWQVCRYINATHAEFICAPYEQGSASVCLIGLRTSTDVAQTLQSSLLTMGVGLVRIQQYDRAWSEVPQSQLLEIFRYAVSCGLCAQQAFVHVGGSSGLELCDVRGLTERSAEGRITVPACRIVCDDIEFRTLGNVVTGVLTFRFTPVCYKIWRVTKDLHEGSQVFVLPKMTPAKLKSHRATLPSKTPLSQPDALQQFWGTQHNYHLPIENFDDLITVGFNQLTLTYPRCVVWARKWTLQPTLSKQQGSAIVKWLTRRMTQVHMFSANLSFAIGLPRVTSRKRVITDGFNEPKARKL
ncbi:MAG: uncharacterized protein KVP18_004689 [Porospora cf. gigantea A]|uniref:uncharacterized protein n=1 Tax=Porospora cf. gigantea A TaxID=2853593 RepID=UPI00355AA411|nr:MAG: hypothetical protein KVP18_004689 [Porospora cf. gigantea A]